MNREVEARIPPEVLEALRRNSGIGLTLEGRFTLHGQPLPNPRVEDLFHRGIAVRGDDVVLTVGARWCYVACEGVARFVHGMRFTATALVVRLSAGEEREVAEPILGYGPDDRFYLWTSAAEPPAILLRSAHQELLSRIDDAMRVATPWGPPIPVWPLDAVPGAATPPPAARPGAGDALDGGPE